MREAVYLAAIVLIVMAFLIVLCRMERAHQKERCDLYNRIMSGSMREYSGIGSLPHRAASAHERTLEKWRAEQ